VIINELADKHNTPRFVPHVTVAGPIEDKTAEEVLKRSRSSVRRCRCASRQTAEANVHRSPMLALGCTVLLALNQVY